MNRAAERGAGEAADVFVDAITRMSFDDARSLLQGGDTAATDYFRRTTSEALRERFTPVVREKMEQVGVARRYNTLVDRVAAIPFVSAPSLSLDGYVTEQALKGLFTVLSDEEKKIRNNPAARVTPLLQRVFGG